MTNLIKRFAEDENGATAIEYGLIAGLLSVAIIGILGTMGGSLTGIFTTINTALSSANGTGSGG
ncbi:Flp family type IVb pilin [Labrenzia sp. PHM005]|uniref:Flp family type IVb pilin n=1 Tax=Labrenzia sp. PHM005 TaxID=2590016 RepID=UPI0011408365|nr:Flp family type IVb pilin [Labrenzia sp. PHM005]QDG76752.1 Flp family type IVb pilin [Labrenzia sp. PHM005]